MPKKKKRRLDWSANRLVARIWQTNGKKRSYEIFYWDFEPYPYCLCVNGHYWGGYKTFKGAAIAANNMER